MALLPEDNVDTFYQIVVNGVFCRPIIIAEAGGLSACASKRYSISTLLLVWAVFDYSLAQILCSNEAGLNWLATVWF